MPQKKRSRKPLFCDPDLARRFELMESERRALMKDLYEAGKIADMKGNFKVR
jgi:hypothetical protein